MKEVKRTGRKPLPPKEKKVMLQIFPKKGDVDVLGEDEAKKIAVTAIFEAAYEKTLNES